MKLRFPILAFSLPLPLLKLTIMAKGQTRFIKTKKKKQKQTITRKTQIYHMCRKYHIRRNQIHNFSSLQMFEDICLSMKYVSFAKKSAQ